MMWTQPLEPKSQRDIWLKPHDIGLKSKSEDTTFEIIPVDDIVVDDDIEKDASYHILQMAIASFRQISKAEFALRRSINSEAHIKRLAAAVDAQMFLYDPEELHAEFNRQREIWEDETLLMSSISDMAMHPAYQRIIGFGKQVIPLILEDLKREPSHWFWALNALSGENPAEGEETLAGAAQAWIEWGRNESYIP